MTRFFHWRKMTWAMLFWSAAMITWLISGVFGGAVVMSSLGWLFGIAVLTPIWFMSRPLWRQGHGARVRRLPTPDSRPVRSYERLATGH